MISQLEQDINLLDMVIYLNNSNKTCVISPDKFLDKIKGDFYGLKWQPKGFFNKNLINQLYVKIKAFYGQIKDIDISEVKKKLIIRKYLTDAKFAMNKVENFRNKDHAKFFTNIYLVFDSCRKIVELMQKANLRGEL